MNQTKTNVNYRIRTAQLVDIPAILALFADEVKAGRMLQRNIEEMQTNIHLWRVAEFNDEIIGCVSLVFFNQSHCEIRSLAVAEQYRQNGLGKGLITAVLDLAKEAGAEKVLTLTRASRVFEPLGFQKKDIRNFPEKVRQDCQPCLFINACDEAALLYQIKKGDLDQ